MTNCFIYMRFSTPQQDKGSSIERQRELCRDYASRQGWDVVEEIVDRGRSAWKGDHLRIGNLGKFAKRVMNGEIPAGSILLVEQLDRLSRLEATEALRWIQDICKQGISIVAASTGKVWSRETLEGQDALIPVITILVDAQRANGESTRKSTFAFDNWKRRHARAGEGKIISKRVPAWLTVAPDKSSFIVDEHRADVVRDIFQKSAEGMGNRMIAGLLNARAEPSFGGGVRWTDKYIGVLLVNPAVEGDYVPGASVGNPGEKIIGYFPRIVEAELVAQARAASASRAGTGGRFRHKGSNLFAQCVRCQSCGGPMTLRPRQASKLSPTSRLRKGLWQCRNAMSRRGCDQRTMYAYAPFESAALDLILHLIMDDVQFARPIDSVRITRRIADLKKAKADLVGKQKRAVNFLLESDDAAPEIKERLTEIRREIADLDGQIQKADEEFSRSRGSVKPEEHVRRVREIQHLIDDADEEKREDARRKISESIKGMGVEVVCGSDRATGEPRIAIMLRLAGLVYYLDTKGVLISGQAPASQVVAVDEMEKFRLADYLRRRADNPPSARPFEGLDWRSPAADEPKITADDIEAFHAA